MPAGTPGGGGGSDSLSDFDWTCLAPALRGLGGGLEERVPGRVFDVVTLTGLGAVLAADVGVLFEVVVCPFSTTGLLGVVGAVEGVALPAVSLGVAEALSPVPVVGVASLLGTLRNVPVLAGLGGGLSLSALGAAAAADSALWEGLAATAGLPIRACGLGLRGGLLRGSDPAPPPPGTGTAGRELVLDPADPVLCMSVVPTASSEFEEFADLTESKEAALLMAPAELLVTMRGTSVATNPGDPWSCSSSVGEGEGPLLMVMVMLSGPLDSDPSRMNIFWCGGVMASGEVAWGELDRWWEGLVVSRVGPSPFPS